MAHSSRTHASTSPSTGGNGRAGKASAGQHAGEFNVGSSLRYTFRFMLQSMQTLLVPYNIPIGTFYFLLTLWKGDGLTQRELSERVGIMGPGTAEQLRRMEKRGLIKRVPSVTDRRKIHVYLTPKGHALKKELLPLARKCNEVALQGFSSTETLLLRRLLSRVRENMNAARQTNGKAAIIALVSLQRRA